MATNALTVAPSSFEYEMVFNDEEFRNLAGGLLVANATGNRWIFTLIYNNRTEGSRRALWADIWRANGKRNLIRLPMSLIGYSRSGTGGGSPVLDGAHTAGVVSLSVSTASQSVTSWLRAGDWVSIGSELKIVTEDVDTDSNGDAVVAIWPELHVNRSDGDDFNIDTPLGDFFLVEASGLGARPGRNDWLNTTVVLTLEEDVTQQSDVVPAPATVSAVIELFDEFNASAGYGPSDDPDGVFYGRVDLADGDLWQVDSVSVANVTVNPLPGGSYTIEVGAGVSANTYSFAWSATIANPASPGPSSGNQSFTVT